MRISDWSSDVCSSDLQGLPSIVMNALAASGLTAERLELEITESVFLNDDDGTDLMFSRLKGIGVRLALDDFGTGYSSLGFLKKAPFDKTIGRASCRERVCPPLPPPPAPPPPHTTHP